MDPWELISYLCKTVVEEQNVYLDILVTESGMEIMLRPLDDED